MKMTIEEFANVVKKEIVDFLPESFECSNIEIKTVTKNNGTKLQALTISKAGSNIAPSIYLEEFYKNYDENDDISDVLKKIAEVRMAHDTDIDFDVKSITEFENCKNRILPRVYNAERNPHYMAERPYTRLEDLIVTYAVIVGDIDGSEGSVAVSNELFKMWGISLEELHSLALNNLKNNDPAKLVGMSQMLIEMMGDRDEANELIDLMPDEEMMWVLTTRSKNCGAAAILDEEMMDCISDKLGAFFIIPSSIHELIIVRDNGTSSEESLTEMIQTVNETEVSSTDILSDHPYRYSRIAGIQSV